MDDSPVQEIQNNIIDNEEIDPLDAYMLEIDKQVHKLDERDKLKEQEVAADNEKEYAILDGKNSNLIHDDSIENEDDDEETIGKAGNFSTVEELIA